MFVVITSTYTAAHDYAPVQRRSRDYQDERGDFHRAQIKLNGYVSFKCTVTGTTDTGITTY